MFTGIDEVSGEWREKSFFDYALNVVSFFRVILFVLLAATMNTVGLGYRDWQYWVILLIALMLSLFSWFIRRPTKRAADERESARSRSNEK